MYTQVAEANTAETRYAAASVSQTDFADDRLTPARGIVAAVLLALPFWGLVAFTVYLLM